MLAGQLALTVAAVFTGAPVYSTLPSSRRVFSSITARYLRNGSWLIDAAI